MSPQPKLLDQLRNVMRRRHYSYQTEKSYLNWIKRFIAFHPMLLRGDTITIICDRSRLPDAN